MQLFQGLERWLSSIVLIAFSEDLYLVLRSSNCQLPITPILEVFWPSPTLKNKHTHEEKSLQVTPKMFSQDSMGGLRHAMQCSPGRGRHPQTYLSPRRTMANYMGRLQTPAYTVLLTDMPLGLGRGRHPEACLTTAGATITCNSAVDKWEGKKGSGKMWSIMKRDGTGDARVERTACCEQQALPPEATVKAQPMLLLRAMQRWGSVDVLCSHSHQEPHRCSRAVQTGPGPHWL